MSNLKMINDLLSDFYLTKKYYKSAVAATKKTASIESEIEIFFVYRLYE